MRRGPRRPRPRLRRPPGQIDLTRVAGLAAVSALFAASPERVERLFYLHERSGDVEAFCQELARRRKPFRRVGVDELARVAGTAMHGGIVALARPRPLLSFDPQIGEAWRKTAPFLVALDGVGNPHNLGAIVRTAAFFGLDRLLVSDHPAQAGPSDAAHRVAEGGLEFVQVYRASGLPDVLKRLKPAYRIVGTALGTGKPLEQVRADRPIVLVLGNEEAGLEPPTMAVCDEIVTLPGSDWVQSLNVAATAAILIHYFARVARLVPAR